MPRSLTVSNRVTASRSSTRASGVTRLRASSPPRRCTRSRSDVATSARVRWSSTSRASTTRCDGSERGRASPNHRGRHAAAGVVEAVRAQPFHIGGEAGAGAHRCAARRSLSFSLGRGADRGLGERSWRCQPIWFLMVGVVIVAVHRLECAAKGRRARARRAPWRPGARSGSPGRAGQLAPRGSPPSAWPDARA